MYKPAPGQRITEPGARIPRVGIVIVTARRLQRLLGRTATSCNSKRDEGAREYSKHGPDPNRRGSLCCLPFENRSRAVCSEEGGRQSRYKHNGSKSPKGLGRARDPRDQHQNEADADSKSAGGVEAVSGDHIAPNRDQSIGREDAGYADAHDEERDE